MLYKMPAVEVRILTARVTDPELAAQAATAIENWCLVHVGRELVVTCEKDHHMTELWDDRAVAVEKNTGRYRRPPGTRSGGLALQIPGQLSIDNAMPAPEWHCLRVGGHISDCEEAELCRHCDGSVRGR